MDALLMCQLHMGTTLPHVSRETKVISSCNL